MKMFLGPLLSFSLLLTNVLCGIHPKRNVPQKRALHPMNLLSTPTNLQLRSCAGKFLSKRQDCSSYPTCEGPCSCFGEGFINCPGDSYYCYRPGDTCYDIDTCNGDSGTPTSAAVPSYVPSETYSSLVPTSTDYCYGSCLTCWGQGYTECPSNDGFCYEPDNSTSVCPDGTSGDSGTGSCAETYGQGSVACHDACYNPGEGESCCSNGCKSRDVNAQGCMDIDSVVDNCNAGTMCSTDGTQCLPTSSGPGSGSAIATSSSYNSPSKTSFGATNSSAAYITASSYGVAGGTTSVRGPEIWSSPSVPGAGTASTSGSIVPQGGAVSSFLSQQAVWSFVFPILGMSAGILLFC